MALRPAHARKVIAACDALGLAYRAWDEKLVVRAISAADRRGQQCDRKLYENEAEERAHERYTRAPCLAVCCCAFLCFVCQVRHLVQQVACCCGLFAPCGGTAGTMDRVEAGVDGGGGDVEKGRESGTAISVNEVEIVAM